MSRNLHVVWFKRDLRLADHRALSDAAQRGRILPLFVAEPELWRQKDMSARQWGFVSECLHELRAELAELGQPLIVRVGDVVQVLSNIHQQFGVAGLWSHEETGNAWTFGRDRDVKSWCRCNGVPWTEARQSGVIRGLKSRTGWARRWDRFMAETTTAAPVALAPLEDIASGSIPTASELGLAADPCPDRQAGGRREGLRVLDSFLQQRGRNYRRAMSSPVTAFGECSRLSPYLAWGAVSMRETAQATWVRRADLKQSTCATAKPWRGAIASFEGRLHWRDHFTQKLEDEPQIEFENLHRAYDRLRPAEPDVDRLNAWSNGETGLPFVDACMRALTATGWMNFRMRAMLMAVASYHLWLDWRAPGAVLARLFTDYEPGIHWPQAQMQSGTTGINTVRIYNPVKQGKDQDPDGVFVRRWVPELRRVPSDLVHEPWRWEGAPSLLGKSYPFPIVDHLTAAKSARQKVWAVRSQPEYRTIARDIQQKHGSRRSGMKMTGRRRKRSPRSPQLSFDI